MNKNKEYNKFDKDNLRIVYMGTPEFAVLPLRMLIDESFNVVAVVTQPDRRAGRKMCMKPSPVKRIALENGIKVMQPEKLREESFVKELESLSPGLIVTAAYGKILPPEILNMPKYGCINIHASLLPKYRGAAPVQWCLFNGDKKSGITIIKMDEGMDTGPIIHREEIKIPEDFNAGMLLEALCELGGKAIVDIIPKYCSGSIKPCPQDEEQASKIRPISKKDCKIDWNTPAENVLNKIRGANPCPGAYTFYKGGRVKICDAKIPKEFSNILQPGHRKLKPGSIIRSDDKSKVFVMCSDKPLELKSIKMEGCKQMSVSQCAHNLDLTERMGGN